MTSSTVQVSPESYADLAGGVSICYQTFGDPSDEAILLVMGLGGPMNWWDPALCTMLADRGFFVIRFDNRDTGRSTRIDGRINRRMLLGSFVGARRRTHPPYTLTNMADDAFGLLDSLRIDSAHVVGVSMGGMIAQTMAIARPERVRSLTSIMSTTGRRSVGWTDPRLLPMMLTGRAASAEEYVAASARLWALIGSPAYRAAPEEVRERAMETWARGVSPAGVARQMAAILVQPDRGPALADLRMPVLVIHGLVDKMVHVSGGRTTARAIPGAELLLVPGMGHDIPQALYPRFVDAIARTASRAR